jgi:hypothetical protein
VVGIASAVPSARHVFESATLHCDLGLAAPLVSARTPAIALTGFRPGLALSDLLAIPGNVFGRHQWDHLKEERRRTEIETHGRASVADLYE